MNKGIWYAVGAYVSWGLFPIYWKWLHQVPALQLLSHRIGWSSLLLLVVILLTKQWQEMVEREIESTDRVIDGLAYELYGLSEEEIKIVER
jgi:chloramphenicol-sensitive protein RarD